MRESMIGLDIFQAFKGVHLLCPVIFLSTFIGGCSGVSDEKVTEVISIPSIPLSLIDPPDSTNQRKNTDYSSQFDPLKSKSAILKSISFGRNDPFQLPEVVGTDSIGLSNNLSFTGIIKVNGLVRALLTNKKFSGSLVIGDLGGKDTDLIPNGWIVESIDEKKEELTLSSKDQNITLELQKL